VVLPVRGTTDQVTVAIAPVDASGMPIVGSPLTSTTVAFTKPAAYTSIDFSFPSRPSVVGGKQYAIVLSSPNEAAPSIYVAWQADLGSSVGDQSGARCANGVYPGGRAWTMGSPPLGADADFFFETYVVPAPANQPPAGKPAAATISAVSVRSLPAAPTPGVTFTVRASIALSTGGSVTPTSTKCSAKLAGVPLKGSGRGGCTFRIPKSAGGKRLTVSVTAGYEGKSKTKTVGYIVRRTSLPPHPPPPPPPPPPAPPSPFAQPGHYAGTSSRGAAVSFDVRSDSRYITNITFGYSLPCSPSGTLDNPAFAALPTAGFGIAADGTFAPFTNTTFKSSSGGASVTVTFAGRFTGPGATSGTLELRGSATQNGVAYTCGPVTDSWTAARA
jgi:hypothetical protein